MALSNRLPSLESEPKALGLAPPPYRLGHDDDSTSGRWSDTSFSSAGKHRSWNNLVSNEVNPFPKPSSTASTTTYSTNPMPAKVPMSSAALGGSNVSMNQNYYCPQQEDANYRARPASRQQSLGTNHSMVSEFFVMPKGSVQKLNYATPMPSGATPIPLDNPPPASLSSRPKRDRMEDLRRCWRKPAAKFCCAALALVLIAGICLAIILPIVLIMPKNFTFNWLAPEMLRQRQTAANNLQLDIQGDQARFRLHGAVPFRSNFISIYDFRSNKIAIVDSSLQNNGKTLVCFVMDLNRDQFKDLSTLQNAAKNALKKTNQTQGWQESWNYVPSPSSTFNSASVFHPDVEECRGARWVELTYVNSNQKPMKCSDCYDFCLPDYGIEKDMIRGEEYLNIVKRNCFYYFVSEWRNYAQAYVNQQGQATGGIGGQPQTAFGQNPQNAFGQNRPTSTNVFGQQMGQNPNQPGQPIQQFHLQNGVLVPQSNPPNTMPNPQFGSGTNNGGGGGGGMGVDANGQPIRNGQESRWISLSTVPQQIANRTSELIGQARQQVNQWGQQVGQNLGLLPNQQQQQQQQQPNNLYGPQNPLGAPGQQSYGQGQIQSSVDQFGRPIVQPPNQQPQDFRYNTQNPGGGMGPQYTLQNGQLANMQSNIDSQLAQSQPQQGNPLFGGASGGGMNPAQNGNPNYRPQAGVVLPSDVFARNQEVAQQQGRIVENQPLLPANPQEYFRQQQLQQQQQQQKQQQQQNQQQLVGLDLSATIPPHQQQQQQHQNGWSNNFGR